MISSNFEYDEHIKLLAKKNMDLFSRLGGVLGPDWGYKKTNLTTLYKCVFIPRVTYAANFFYAASSRSRNISILKSIHRRPLLGITGAHQTTAFDSLAVIAGVLPLDLEVRWQAFKAENKHSNDDTKEIEHSNIIEQRQLRWSNSSKRRLTHEFIPSIRQRLATLLLLNHFEVQMLSGHGNFRDKLFSFVLVNDPYCLRCNNLPETPKHVIFVCTRNTHERESLKTAVTNNGHQWPCTLDVFLSTRIIYEPFFKFTTVALIDP